VCALQPRHRIAVATVIHWVWETLLVHFGPHAWCRPCILHRWTLLPLRPLPTKRLAHRRLRYEPQSMPRSWGRHNLPEYHATLPKLTTPPLLSARPNGPLAFFFDFVRKASCLTQSERVSASCPCCPFSCQRPHPQPLASLGRQSRLPNGCPLVCFSRCCLVGAQGQYNLG
jgi:hypothetical protein